LFILFPSGGGREKRRKGRKGKRGRVEMKEGKGKEMIAGLDLRKIAC